jgi:hypothetical protein
MVYKAMIHVEQLRMSKLSPAPTAVAQNRLKLLSEQSLYKRCYFIEN